MARDGFKVFDSDMHILEPPDLWERYMDAEFRSQAPRGLTSDSVRDLRVQIPGMPPQIGAHHRGRNFERNQVTYADHARRGWSPEVQLEAMDVEGLDAAVLFPSRGLSVLTTPNLERGAAAAIARAYNDWLAEFCQGDPARMFGAGMISVYDINDAIEETHRVVEELGFRAIFTRANVVNGKSWHDPYYEPLWETLEQMLALGSFIGGGVLARHPKLNVAFLEANCSWVPWLVWRLDEHYELEGDLYMPELEMMPSEYFRRQCLVSVEPDEVPARHMIEDFGADQLVFSTDYPHGDSRYPRATASFLELPISDADKRKILWDNCARFYHVEEKVTA